MPVEAMRSEATLSGNCTVTGSGSYCVSIFCIITESTQLPSLNPAASIVPTCRKPKDLCNFIEPVLLESPIIAMMVRHDPCSQSVINSVKSILPTLLPLV